MDTRESRVEQAALPRRAIFTKIGREDGAVVAGRVLAVGGEPRFGFGAKCVDVDHPRDGSGYRYSGFESGGPIVAASWPRAST